MIILPEEQKWLDQALVLLCRNTKIDPNTSCWNYSNINSQGYGQIKIGNEQFSVHRLAARIFFGFDMDSRYVVMHKCDNRKCWFPEHIIPSTASENHLDAVKKGTLWNVNLGKEFCIHGHEFTEKNTYHHKDKRYCKHCKADRELKRRHSKGIESKPRYKY